MLDRTGVDLNKPAFGVGSQKLTETEDTSVEDTKQEEEVEEVEEGAESSVEETKVPYSRFKNIHNRAKEAEEEADKWRARAEELEQSRYTKHEVEESSDMPSSWQKLYGDNDASKEAWKIQ